MKLRHLSSSNVKSKFPKTGFAVALAAIALIIGFFLLFFGETEHPAPSARKSLAEPSPLVQKEIKEIVPVAVAPPEILTTSSFTDLFSGIGWLDVARTTMQQDTNTTAFTFPPKYMWREIEKNAAYDFSAKPPGLVGKVIKVGDVYKGLIYKTDGTPIFDETNTPFISKYKGELGFGGSDDDWIVIYSGYEGIAYRIQISEIGSPKIENISRFFGNRVMNGGFEPAILRSGSNWYIYSLTENNPKFIKLFQNGTNEIKGAFDFSPLLFGEAIKKTSFTLGTGEGNVLAARAEMKSSEEKFYEFIDERFDKKKKTAIYSANINNYSAEVRTAAISVVDLAKDVGEIKFYLSNDGEKWLEADIGKEIVFPKKDGRQLMWRAEFSPDSNSETSPFFSSIRLDYKVKFL